MADKTLLEKVEEASRRPVPDRTTSAERDWSSSSRDDSDRRASDANPSDREDFRRLLNAAAARED
jgi:hypothetical protein